MRISHADKIAVVMMVLRGDESMAAAALKAGVSAQTVRQWKDKFVAAGEGALAPSARGGSPRERRLLAEIDELKLALAESCIEARKSRSTAK